MNYFLIQYIFNHIDVALIVKDKLFNDKFAVDILYQYDFVVYKMNTKLYFSFILLSYCYHMGENRNV